MNAGGNANGDLMKENEDLRRSLKEQQRVTEEVRREAQEFLREMRMLSQQSGSAWEKQAELEKTIESLESEVRTGGTDTHARRHNFGTCEPHPSA